MYSVSDIEYMLACCFSTTLLSVEHIQNRNFMLQWTAQTLAQTDTLKKLNSKKKYEQMCVCMQIVEIKAYVSF